MGQGEPAGDYVFFCENRNENVHLTTQDETVDTKGSFCEQSKHVFDKLTTTQKCI
jgi:hypothetical protein